MPYKGRNAFLDTITPPEPGSELAGARLLPLDTLEPNPYQSRQVFNEGTLAELAASIQEHGVLQPIVVRAVGDRFQIVAGERRSRAARLAGVLEIPAIIREFTDQQAAYATAIENLQREDLDLEDEARQYQQLLALTGLSQRALAAQLGVSHNYIAERVRLLDRSDLLAAYRSGSLTLRQALGALREPSTPPVTVIPDYTEADSSSSREDDTLPDDRSVIRDYTKGDSKSVIRDDNPVATAPIERAALDRRTGAGRDGLTQIPYRARALDSAATTLLRLDWHTVPPGERATVREQIALLEQALAAAKTALAEGAT